MTLRNLAFTILYVDDLDRELQFYRDVVGLPIAYSVPGWIQFDTKGAALVLHPKIANEANTGARASTAHIGFQVENLESEFNRLTANHVDFLAPPASAAFAKHATFADPEGNAVDLLEWKQAPSMLLTSQTVVNDIIAPHPETMEVFENHGIRICGGCLVLLNAPVSETAEYSGLDAQESSELVEELKAKLARETANESMAR